MLWTANEIKLPKKEFEILSLMIANKGKIFTREELLSRIWPEQVVVVDRVVDVNITRLRSKIGTYGKNIVTRSGVWLWVSGLRYPITSDYTVRL